MLHIFTKTYIVDYDISRKKGKFLSNAILPETIVVYIIPKLTIGRVGIATRKFIALFRDTIV